MLEKHVGGEPGWSAIAHEPKHAALAEAQAAECTGLRGALAKAQRVALMQASG